MLDKKVIAVVGATGAQGGGLVRAILADPIGRIHGAGAHPRSGRPAAKALAAAGAEVVAADVDDPESLKRAFAGAYGAFCVTFFWEHFSPEKELAQAKALADAAKAARLPHVIWSTLEDTRTLRAAHRRSHADAAGQVQGAALRRQGRGGRVLPRRRRADDVPADVVLLGQLHPLRHGPEEGRGRRLLAISCRWADKKLPGIAAEDIGKCAYGIFKGALSTIGKTIGIAGEHLTGDEMADGAEPGARHSPSATTTCRRPTCTAASGSPAPTTSATCSRSIAGRLRGAPFVVIARHCRR